jgi:hypothetical protein
MTNVKCAHCGAVNYADVVTCRRCSETLASAVTMSDHQDIAVGDDPRYGFGGWLFVFVFLLLLYLVKNGFSFAYEVQALYDIPEFTGGRGQPKPVAQIQYVLVFGVLAHGGFLIFGLIVIRALRKVREIASTLAVMFLMSAAIFQIIDWLVTRSLLAGMSPILSFNIEVASLMWMITSLVQVLIWWPYFKRSKRMNYGYNN